MSREFPFDLLRPDAPPGPAFSVAQLPYRAKLDQNESPGDLPPEVKRTLADALVEARWNRFPQPGSTGRSSPVLPRPSASRWSG